MSKISARAVSSLLLSILSGVLLHICSLEAQQSNNFLNRVIYSNDYYFSLPMYNPAFTGEDTQPSISISGRTQQSPQEVNPYTVQALAQGFAPSLKSGFGFALQYHKFDDIFYNGLQQQIPTNKRLFNMGLLYSYMFEVGEVSVLKLGLGASLLHFKSDEIYYSSPSSVSVVAVNERTFKPSFDVGLSATLLNFYIGVSVKYFNEPKFKFYEPGLESTFSRSSYITAGYRLPLLQDRLIIRPSIMVNPLSRNNGNSFGNNGGTFFDASVLFSYKDIAFAGTSYKLNDDPFYLSLLVGARLNKTYQFTFSYHLPKKSFTEGYSRYEASIGLYLQSSRYAKEEDAE